MSVLPPIRGFPKLMSARFETEKKEILLAFPAGSFKQGDMITTDYRYGLMLHIYSIFQIEGAKDQILRVKIVTNEGDGWEQIELKDFLPGQEFKLVSTTVGEYDPM